MWGVYVYIYIYGWGLGSFGVGRTLGIGVLWVGALVGVPRGSHGAGVSGLGGSRVGGGAGDGRTQGWGP